MKIFDIFILSFYKARIIVKLEMTKIKKSLNVEEPGFKQ